MLDKEKAIQRFRLSSIELNLLNDEVSNFVAHSERFVPPFHILLQSGSNKTLTLMRRHYERELYVERVNAIKVVMPQCSIGADVIVGFPGETEEAFLATYHFLNELPITYLHVFPYSERNNTHATSLEGEGPRKKERDAPRCYGFFLIKNNVASMKRTWELGALHFLSKKRWMA